MSQWWICPQDSQVVIDDASMIGVDCSAVAADVYLVWWYGTNGEILYKHSDRVPVREPFTDLTPLIGLFTNWMQIAKTKTPPLTLTQSKSVKSSMVDALFASKRQMPVTYLGHEWSGSDEATGAMTDQIAAVSGTDAINSAVGALAGSVNDALTALKGSVNAAMSDLAGDVNSADQSLATNAATGIDAAHASYSGNVNGSITSLNGSLGGSTETTNTIFTEHGITINNLVSSMPAGSVGLGTVGSPSMPNPPPPTAASVSPPSGISAAPVTAPPVAATPASGPDITWPPLDGPPVTMTYVQFTTLLSMLTSRRNSLQLVRTAHKNNIAAMTTVDAVIAYDITAGW